MPCKQPHYLQARRYAELGIMDKIQAILEMIA